MYNPPTLQNNLYIPMLEKNISKGLKVKVVQNWRQQQFFNFANSNGQILDNRVVKIILKGLYIWKFIGTYVWHAYVHT